MPIPFNIPPPPDPSSLFAFYQPTWPSQSSPSRGAPLSGHHRGRGASNPRANLRAYGNRSGSRGNSYGDNRGRSNGQRGTARGARNISVETRPVPGGPPPFGVPFNPHKTNLGPRRPDTILSRDNHPSTIAAQALFATQLVPKSSREDVPAHVASTSKKRKRPKSLGLVPKATSEASSDSNDDDDPPPTGPHDEAIQVLYNGKALDLRNKEQVKAWLAERKRKAPSRYRRQKEQQEVENKAAKTAQETSLRHESQNDVTLEPLPHSRSAVSSVDQASDSNGAYLAPANAPKAMAEQSTQPSQQQKDQEDLSRVAEVEVTSRSDHKASAPTPLKSSTKKSKRQACLSYHWYGSCPRSQCKFSHETGTHVLFGSEPSRGGALMSLSQRLRESQRQEENEKVLSVLKDLAQKGLLDE